MTALPASYAWLNAEGATLPMLREQIRLYGVLEAPGAPSNPVIVAWADEVAKRYPSTYNNWAAHWFDNDGIAWCGLDQATCAARAGFAPPNEYLSAGAWAKFGTGVPVGEEQLGDILIYDRTGGHHVCQYVGTDRAGYRHVFGGNQSDAVNIHRRKDTPVAVRRPPYASPPPNRRRITLNVDGSLLGPASPPQPAPPAGGSDGGKAGPIVTGGAAATGVGAALAGFGAHPLVILAAVVAIAGFVVLVVINRKKGK